MKKNLENKEEEKCMREEKESIRNERRNEKVKE